jgi:hypothetical protein
MAARRANVRRAPPLQEYQRTHDQINYTEMSRAVEAVGGQPLMIQTNGGLVTPREADAIIIAAIPTDAFTVSGYWSQSIDQDGNFLSWFASWNFRNTYDTGGAPRDAMGAQTSDLSSSCWLRHPDGAWAYTELGDNANGRISRRSADFDSAVWQVDEPRRVR